MIMTKRAEGRGRGRQAVGSLHIVPTGTSHEATEPAIGVAYPRRPPQHKGIDPFVR